MLKRVATNKWQVKNAIGKWDEQSEIWKMKNVRFENLNNWKGRRKLHDGHWRLKELKDFLKRVKRQDMRLRTNREKEKSERPRWRNDNEKKLAQMDGQIENSNECQTD
jgi:hypothetical protein